MASIVSSCKKFLLHRNAAQATWAIGLAWLVMTVMSCSKSERSDSILPDDAILQTGDIVFRRGEGVTSRVVLAADAKGNYSHVGIVVDSAGCKMIVHAVPGEPDYDGDADRVKMDTPEKFFNSTRASKGEVCRPRNNIAAHKAAATALRMYRKGVLFDDDFDDKDTTKMYCTELIVYAFQLAGIDITEGRRHRVDLPIIKAVCIFPSDIYCSRHLRSIMKFHL